MLLGPNGEPLLADFGLSRISDSSLKFSSSSGGGGTCRWNAIELSGGSDIDKAEYTKGSDVWAFGMVLYVSI